MFDRQSPETLSAYADDYGLLHDVQPATLHQYKVCCRLFDAWAGHAVRLDELDERSLSLFLAHYAASGVSPSTVRAKRVQLLSLWRAASDEGFCDLPTRRIRPAKVPFKAPVAWTMAEVVQLLAACDTLPRLHSCGLRRSEWFSLAIRVGWDLGLRWADQVYRLRVDMIGVNGVVAFTQHKTGRLVIGRLSESTLEALRSSLAYLPRDLATPWHGSHETFNDQMRTLVAKSGIRKGTWKWLRRSGATDVELQQAGAATRHLGHAPGSSIAARHYIDPAILHREFVSPSQLPKCPIPPPPPPLVRGGLEGGRTACGETLGIKPPRCLRRATSRPRS